MYFWGIFFQSLAGEKQQPTSLEILKYTFSAIPFRFCLQGLSCFSLSNLEWIWKKLGLVISLLALLCIYFLMKAIKAKKLQKWKVISFWTNLSLTMKKIIFLPLMLFYSIFKLICSAKNKPPTHRILFDLGIHSPIPQIFSAMGPR